MMGALRYALDEAVVSLWRGRRSGVLSTATIGIALFVLGGFLLFTSNLDRLGDEWSRAAELSVYLVDEVTAADRALVERLLVPGPLVASVEFVSKEAALQRFKQTFRIKWRQSMSQKMQSTLLARRWSRLRQTWNALKLKRTMPTSS